MKYVEIKTKEKLNRNNIFKIFFRKAKKIIKNFLFFISCLSILSYLINPNFPNGNSKKGRFLKTEYERVILLKSEKSKEEVLLASETFLEKITNLKEIYLSNSNKSLLEKIKEEKKRICKQKKDWWENNKKWVNFIEITNKEINWENKEWVDFVASYPLSCTSTKLAEYYIGLINDVLKNNQINIHNLDIRFDEKEKIWKRIKNEHLAINETRKFFFTNSLSKISKLVIKKLYGENSNKKQIFFIDSILKAAILSLIKFWLVDQEKIKNSGIWKKLASLETSFKNREERKILNDIIIDMLLRITLLSQDLTIKEMPIYIKSVNIWIFMIFKVLFADSFSYFVEKRTNIESENEIKERLSTHLAKNMTVLVILHLISIWFSQDLDVSKKILFFLTLDSLLSDSMKFTAFFSKNNLKKKKIF